MNKRTPYTGLAVFFVGPRFAYPESLTLYFANAVLALGGVPAGIDERMGEVMHKPDEYRWGEVQLHTNPESINLLMVVKGEGLGKEFVTSWKEKNSTGKSVLYWPDPINKPVMEFLRDRRPYFDHLFVACRGTDAQMKELDAKWIPVGYDSILYYPQPKEPEIHDCVFIGTKRPGRGFIPKLSPRPEIYGNNWDKIPHNPAVYLDDKRRLMQQTKILLNQHYRTGILPTAPGSGPNCRFWEILASQRCMLTDMIPEMEMLGFKAGGDFFAYSDSKECEEVIRSLLQSPEERKRVAENGCKAVQGHSYIDRLLTMATYLDLK